MARPRKDGTGNKPGLPKGSGELANAEAVFEKWYKGNQKVFGHIAEQNKQLRGLNSNFIKLIETLVTAEDMKSVAEALKAEGVDGNLSAEFEPWLGDKSPILNQLVIMTTHLENLNGFISPISKFFTEANENAGPGSVNLAGGADKNNDGIPDNLQGGGAGGAGGKGGGGLGGLLTGFGTGAGMAMGGAGVLAGGVGLAALGIGGGTWLMLNALEDFDGAKAAQNYVDFVRTLDQISAGDVTRVSLMMGVTGIGQIFLAIGETATIVADGIEHLNVKYGTGMTAAQAIARDFEELSKIDIVDIDQGKWLKLQIGLPLMMTALGAGMAVWGAGKTLPAITEGIETLNKSFGGRRVAEGIKEDIEMLLSTDLTNNFGGADNEYGKKELVGTMTALSAAMVVWSAGKGLSGLAEGIDNLARIGPGGRRTSVGIKEDIETLLSIDATVDPDDFRDLMKAMNFLGLSMITWGGGSFIAGIGRLVENAANWSSGKEGQKTNADAIKYSIETILSTDLTSHNSSSDWEETAKAISAIGKSMTSVGWGHIVTGIGTLWDNDGKGEDNVTKIKNTVEKLLTITDMRDVKRRSEDLKVILGNVGDAMSDFAVDDWIESYLGVITSINHWISGDEGMIGSLTSLLEAGANIDKLNSGLETTRQKLKLFTSEDWTIDSNLKEFAQDLADSLPTMEAAIMGNAGWTDYVDPFKTHIKGLASPEVDWELASNRMAGFRAASGMMSAEDFNTYKNTIMEQQKLDMLGILSAQELLRPILFGNNGGGNTQLNNTNQVNNNQIMSSSIRVAPIQSGMKVGQ